jgi:hypothetical protein
MLETERKVLQAAVALYREMQRQVDENDSDFEKSWELHKVYWKALGMLVADYDSRTAAAKPWID